MTRAPGPFSLRDLTEPSRFKNPFAPIPLLRIFILQLLRGDFCNKILQKRTLPQGIALFRFVPQMLTHALQQMPSD
jgi:hypothetical protein